MEQMTGYALSGICNAESPEMTHARVQEACIMAEKMLQNSIEMVEYKGKTMGEWVKSVKKLQQLEDHLREAMKKIEQLQTELDAAVKDLHYLVNHPQSAGSCYACKHTDECYSGGDCDPVENDRWEWRGVQKD